MLIICTISIISIGIYKISYSNNKQEAQEILRIAYTKIDGVSYETDSLDSSQTDEKTKSDEIELAEENDIIGVLIINKLNIEAPIKEGTSQEVMKTSIGHFIESDYWNGNVSLASHNGGTSMHYFQYLHKLDINDEIIYKTCLGERKYKVQSISNIDDTDWSMVKKSSNLDENTITLITCINGKPDKRLCVRGIEI